MILSQGCSEINDSLNDSSDEYGIKKLFDENSMLYKSYDNNDDDDDDDVAIVSLKTSTLILLFSITVIVSMGLGNGKNVIKIFYLSAS